MTLSHPLGVSIPRARELTRAGALRSSATTPQPRPHDLTDHRFASVAKGPSEPRKEIITISCTVRRDFVVDRIERSRPRGSCESHMRTLGLSALGH
jgi:hypothetical protein